MARLSSDSRRAQLLSTGREVFAAHAYDAVSIDDLAAAAEVSKGLLYHYFPDKRAFYEAVLRQSAMHVLECTTPSPDGIALDALGEALSKFVSYVESNAPFYRALIRGGVGSDGKVEAVVEDVRRQTVQRVVERLALPDDASTQCTVYGWVGFTEFTVLDWLDRRHLPQEALVLRLTTALLQLLAPT